MNTNLTLHEYACLPLADQIWFVRTPPPQPGSMESPVLQLLRRLPETARAQETKFLRNRLWLSYVPSEMCRQIIKVVAKRFMIIDNMAKHLHADPRPKIELTSIDPSPPLLNSHAVSGKDLRLCDRPLKAVITDKNGTVLAQGQNSVSRHRVRHAEIEALFNFTTTFSSPLPLGAQIFCSLKPCRMCAAALVQAATDPRNIRVFYKHDDPGRWARHTILETYPDQQMRWDQNVHLPLGPSNFEDLF